MGLTGLIDSLLNWIDAISSGRTQAAIIAVEAVASILGAIALIVVIAQSRRRYRITTAVQLANRTRELAAGGGSVATRQDRASQRDSRQGGGAHASRP